MSADLEPVDDSSWEQYLTECRIAQTIPTLSDYSVFLSDSDQEESEAE